MAKTADNRLSSVITPSERMRELMLKLKTVGSYRALEPRMVFDGAAVDTADQTLTPEAPANAATAQEGDATASDTMDVVAALASVPVVAEGAARTLIFIDSKVTDLQALAEAISHDGQIVILDSNRDGLEQIAEVVSQYSSLDAIHIVSHGAEGQLFLGNSVVSAASMRGEHLDELTTIGQALSADGDILIYGCDFAAGAAGLEAAMILGGITGADIGASTDDTGHADLGGDWDLEASIGTVETATVRASDWRGTLPAQTLVWENQYGAFTNINGSPSNTTVGGVTITTAGSVIGTPGVLNLAIDPANTQGNLTGNVRMEMNATVDDESQGLLTTLTFSAAVTNVSFTISDIDASNNNFRDAVYVTFNGSQFATAANVTLASSTLTYNQATGRVGNNDGTTSYSATQTGGNATFNFAGPVTTISFRFAAADALGVADPTQQFVAIQDISFTSNDPPVLDLDASGAGTGFTSTFTEYGPSVQIVDADSLITDADDVNIESATFVISNVQAGDILSVAGALPAGITAGAYNSVTGTITLTGSATKAAYETALEQIRFSSTSSDPVTTARIVNITVSDGALDSNTAVATVNVVPVHEPIVDLNSGPTITTSGPSTTVATSSSNLITNGGFGTAAGNPPGPWTEADASGVGAVVLATGNGRYDWTAANGLPTLSQSVTLPANSSNNTVVTTTTATSTTVTDTTVATTHAITSISFDMAWQNRDINSPNDNILIISYNGTELARFETAEAGTQDGVGLLGTWTYASGVSGPAAAATTSVADEVTGGMSAVVLTFATGLTVSGPLLFSYTGGSTGAGSDDLAIDNVVVTNTATVTTTVNSVVTTTADTADNNWTANYTENGPAVSIADTDSSIFDADDTNMESATITLTNPAAGDRLLVNGLSGTSGTLASGISWTRTDTNVVLSGSFTKAQYADAIELIQFQNTTENPSSTPRTIHVIANDGIAISNTAVATITVTPVNDAPVAVDDAISVTEDTPFTSVIQLDANDSDVDGNPLTVVAGTFATSAGGSIVIASNGSYTYTPPANFTGADFVDYTVTDGALTDIGRLTITVTPVNDAPVAVDDAISVAEDTPFTSVIQLDANDTDIDNASLTVVAGTFATSAGGSIVIAADGSYTYTPPANFTGTDFVDYTVTDGALTDVGRLTITVTPVNDAPVAVDDAIAVAEDTPFTSVIQLDANDSDVDNASLTVVAGTFATSAGGSIVIAANGSYTYTPPSNFTGTDTVDYTVTDGALTDIGRLTITVTPVNDAPVAVDDAISVAEDTPFTSVIQLDANDSDVDNASLTVVAGTFATSAGGSIVIASDGSYTYTPPSNFTGTDFVDYTVTDGALTDVGRLTITVTPVNDAPVAVDDAISVAEDTPFTSVIQLDANDTDIDNASLTVVAGTFATSAGGSIVIASNGSYTYTPPANFTGTDFVDYTVTDGALTDIGRLTITVTPVNDAPVAVDDAISVTEDTPFSSVIQLDANDTDIDNASLTVIAGTFATSAGGSIVIAADGSYTYTPPANFTGADFVDYTVTDGALTDIGRLTITVTPVNDAPVAVDDAVSVAEDTPFTSVIQLDANDTDIDNASLTVVAGTFATSAGGSIVIAANGSYTYTPPSNFVGTDFVDYTVTDGALTDIGRLTITVTPVNDAPVAVDDAISVAEDTPFSSVIQLDANDTDIDNASLTVIAGTFATSAGGSIVIASDGSYTYTPPANFTGADFVDYTVTDGALTDVGRLTITVTPVNDAPVAVDDAISVAEDTPFTSVIQLDANDSDVDNASLTVVAGTFATSAGGSIVIAANGSYTYTPPSNFTGTDTVDYTVTDGALTDIGRLTITVGGSNDPPVAVDDAISVTEDTPFTSVIQLDANDTDIDNASLTVVAGTFATSAGGSIVIAADGSYTYTPPANFTGADFVDYTVTDGALTDIGRLTITVTPVNDAPVAVDDAVSVAEDTPFTSVIQLDANDTDIDNASLTVVAGTFATSAGGSIVIAANGSYTYTPPSNFVGTDFVDYTVTDGALTDIGRLTITVTPVNDAPVAVDDAISVAEDTPFSSVIQLDANDTDIDNASLTVIAGTFATSAGGSIVIASDGSYTYTPPANFTGADFVDYTVTDGALTDVGRLTITVTPVNDAPVAVDDAISVTEDTPFTSVIQLDANDSDVDNASLTVVAGTFATSAGGSIVIAANGSYTYTPPSNFTGTDTVDYTVTDGALTDIGRLTITVGGSNDPPVAVDDAISVTEDTPFTSVIQLDANDTDIDNASLTVVAGTFATSAGGSIVIAADGSYTYTPPANFTGTDFVDYTVTDGALTDVGRLTITVTPVNDAPVAVDDAISVTEDTPFTSVIQLDANDTDIDNASLTVVAGTFATSAGGSIVIAADGSYTYTPPANFTGADFVDYTVTDGALTDVGRLTITVTPVNDAPVAVDDAISVAEDTPFTSVIQLDANDTDIDNASLTVVAGTFATSAGGSIVIAADGSYTYTPPANFTGTDFVDYTVTDGALTDVGRLTITVTPVNDAPVAVDDAIAVAEDTPFTSVIQLDANDSDVDNASLTVIAGTFATAAGGSIVIAADGSYTYTPPANFTGTDFIDYTVTDGALTDIGRLTITVTPVNDAPVAVDDAVSVAEDTPFTSVIQLDANDTDIDNASLTVVAGTFATAAGGSIVIAADGSYTYTPPANFTGADFVDYTVTDGALTDVGRLTITVTPVNDAPVAVDDAIAVAEDTPFTSVIQLDANDSDVDNASLTVVAGTFATSAGGSIVIAANGSYTYTPPSNFTGTDTVDYTVTDGALTDIGRLTITVTPVNDAPVAVDDAISVAEDTPFTSVIQLDANDSDVDNASLTVVAGTFATSAGGSIVIASDGSYTYTPPSNFTGTDFVDYTVTDGALTDVGRLTITVTPVNDAPVAVDDAISVAEDTPFTSVIQLDANDTDIDNASLTVVAGTFATAAGGSIVIASNGSYTYTPPANFTGTDFVDYTVTDGALTDIGRLTITVTPVNDAPVAVDDAISVTEDTPFSSVIQLDANDTDIDNASLTVIAGTFATSAGGSIVIAADGSYTYTPPANFTGADFVDYTVTDGALTDIGRLTITVTPVNDAPVAVDDAVSVAEDTPFTSVIQLDANDTDIDNASLTVVAGTFATSAGGSIVIAANGSYTYTPPSNFVGTDFVDYTVTDGALTDIGRLTITVTPVNDAPVAVDDAISVAEDTPFSSVIQLDANDTDIDNASLTVIAGTFATSAGGSIVIASDGSYTYTPPANFTGADFVDYTVTDGALTDVGRLTITVTPVNDAPVAVDDAISVAEDTPFTSVIQLDANDSDVDGNPLTVVAGTFATSAGGSIVIASDGSYTYTPPANFTGADFVDYTVTDGALTDVGRLTITVTPVNDAPVAVDDAISVAEDTPFTSVIQLDANDSDVDNASLTVVAGTFATSAGGSIVIAANGSYTYTPPSNFTGTDTVDYTVTDGALTDIGRLTITVGGSNDPPVAVDDAISVTEDTPFTSVIQLDANDSDVDGNPLTVVAGTFATSAGGSIVIASNGSYTYTPPANFTGADFVDYTVTDGALTDIGRLTITVTPVNDAPVAVDDAISVTEDTPFTSVIQLDANDSDVDGNPLTVVAGTFATSAGGSIVIASNGSYTYTPPANFTGADFVDYTVTDGALTDIGRLTITVTPVNDAPVAVDDAISVAEDTPFTSVIQLDANDTDIDNASLTVVAGTFATSAGGSIVIAADGSYTYTPPANFTGTDFVDYTVTDGALTDVGRLTITVTPVNDAPVAVDDAISVAEDTPFTSVIQLDANDSDVDNASLTVVAGTFATSAGGSIVIAADGSYTYTPPANFTGTDFVDYTVTDGALTDVGRLTITVTPVNDAPVAVDDAIAVAEDTPFTSVIQLDANDTDIDNASLTVVAGTFATSAGGSIVIAADGSYTYTPPANFTGADFVDYTVTDGALTDVGRLTITVTPVNDAPVAVDDAISVAEDTPFTSVIQLDANDSDVDGNPLTVVAGTFATSAGGSIVIASDGSYTYTPPANFTGADFVDYTVTDGALTDVGRLTITVTPVNDAPVAVDDAISVAEDTPFTSVIQLDANDSDVDNASLTVVAGTFATSAGGSIVIAADGSYTYTPPSNFVGTDTVDYTVTDGALTDVGRLTITVTPVNDAPVAVDDAISVTEDTPFTSVIQLDANDTDIDNASLTVVAGTFATSAGGSIVIAADGSYTYTPPVNFTGTDTVDYTVTDGALTDIGRLTITVGGSNDAPVAVDDAISVTEDTPFTSVIQLDANDSDVDNASLTVIAGTFATAAGGSIVIAANGSYTYTPPSNFTGTDTVDYTVTDGALTDVGRLTITVTPVNDAPVAVDDAVSVAEDTPFTSVIQLDANDSDVDNASLTVIAGTFATAAGGSIVIAADGSYTYTPPANFTGADFVDYTVTDGALTDIGRLTITVTPVNDAPVAVDDAISVAEDTPFSSVIQLDANDSDVDNASLTVVAGTFATAAGGSIVIAADGSYTYTPPANFTGADFVDYTVTDGALTDVGRLTITVTPVNDAPVAVDDAISVTEDTPFTSVIQLDANDSDVDNASLTVIAGTFATSAGGSIVIAADGSYTYTPPANFTGADFVDYTVTDGALTDVGRLTITVTPVNDAPVAVDDAIAVAEDTPFTSVIQLDANDSDVDNASLTVVAGTFATSAGGSIVIAADGSYTYTPPSNFTGTDTVDYTVTDGALTDIGRLTITVTPVNDAPVAVDDAVTTPEDSPASGSIVLGDAFGGMADIDVDQDTLSITNFTVLGDPATYAAGDTATVVGVGTLLINSNGSYTFTPEPNYNGPGPVATYTVTDGALTDVGRLTITVTPVNDAPVAVDDAVSVAEDTPFTSVIQLDANDSDVDNASLTVVAGTFATSAGGSIVIAANGSYTYTPPANFVGTDFVDYTVSDGALTDVGRLTITVTPVNDAPVAVDDAVTTPEDSPASGSIVLGDAFGGMADIDVDQDTLSITNFTVLGDPATYAAGDTATVVGVGTILINSNGSYTFTSEPNYNGPGPVATYTVTDGTLSDVGRLTITVTPVNDAPVAVDDAISVAEDTPFSSVIQLDANDSDVDGNPLTVVAGTFATSAGGSIVVAADGSYSYTPPANFTGTDTVDYTVTDGALTDIGRLTITVTPVNDAPVAVDDAISVAEDTPFTSVIQLDANDTDVDGNPLTVVAGTFATSAGGSIVIAADGSYTYTPPVNFTGTDTVDYTVTDGALTDIGRLTITRIDETFVATDEPVSAVEEEPTSSPYDLTDDLVDGIILETVRGVQSLDGIAGRLSEHGIVIAAANQASSLNGLAASDYFGLPGQPVALPDARVWQIEQALDHSGYRRNSDWWDVQGLTGFSLRLDLPNAEQGAASQSQVIVESLVRDRTLIVQISSSISGSEKYVQEYRFSQANGRPLPDWINRASTGLLIGLHPANVDSLDLRVTVHYSDGTFDEKSVRIETKTGDIKPIAVRRDASLTRQFFEQFASREAVTMEGIQDLADVLRH